MFLTVFCLGLIAYQPVSRDSILALIKTGQFEEASREVEKIIPKIQSDYLLLGFLYFANRDEYITYLSPKVDLRLRNDKIYDYIIQTWTEYTAENSKNQFVLTIMAMLYVRRDIDRAIFYAEEIGKIDTLNSYVYAIYGYNAFERDNFDEGLEYFRKAYLINPKPFVVGKIAYSYLSQNNYDSAFAYFTRVPKNHIYYDEYLIGAILCKLKLGEYNIAESLLASADIPDTCINERETYGILSKYLDLCRTGSMLPSDTTLIFAPPIFALLAKDSIDIIDPREVKKPEPISRPLPKYPKEVQKKNIEGTVIIKMLINTEGNVQSMEFLLRSGNDLLDQSALEAAQKTKFQPAMVRNKPISTWIVYPVMFRLK